MTSLTASVRADGSLDNTGRHNFSFLVLDDEIVFQKGSLETVHRFGMQVAHFLQRFVIREQDELFTFEVFVEDIHTPDCGSLLEKKR